jgi:hypothetical protein
MDVTHSITFSIPKIICTYFRKIRIFDFNKLCKDEFKNCSDWTLSVNSTFTFFSPKLILSTGRNGGNEMISESPLSVFGELVAFFSLVLEVF